MDDKKTPEGIEFEESVRRQLEELAKLAPAILESQQERERRRWLIGGIKRVILWLAGTIVGIGVVWDAVAKVWHLLIASMRP